MALSAGHKARAASIAKALSGRKAGNGWTARCPAHDDRTQSLSIRDADDNKVPVRCHAGCDQERVISALRSRGLWVENSPRSASLITRRATIERKPDHDDTKRTKAALAIWHSAKPSHGTPVETYLASRARPLSWGCGAPGGPERRAHGR
jgi:putative DNA primase/helicase